jgi:hypothetical protein
VTHKWAKSIEQPTPYKIPRNMRFETRDKTPMDSRVDEQSSLEMADNNSLSLQGLTLTMNP